MLIETTKGLMEADELEKREGVDDSELVRIAWVEYWHDGELVHRSAHGVVKVGLSINGFVRNFS